MVKRLKKFVQIREEKFTKVFVNISETKTVRRLYRIKLLRILRFTTPLNFIEIGKVCCTLLCTITPASFERINSRS